MPITASLQRRLTAPQVNILVEVFPPALADVRGALGRLGLSPFHDISVAGLAFLSIDNVPNRTVPRIASVPGVENVHFDFDRTPLRFLRGLGLGGGGLLGGGLLRGVLEARAAGFRARDFIAAPGFAFNLASNRSREPSPGVIGTEEVWKLGGGPAAEKDGIDGSKTRVAVIDTGAWARHQALADVQTDTVSRFILDRFFDSSGHGSWTAAMVSSPPNVSPSGVRCRGMSRAKVLAVKTLRTPVGFARVSDVLKAIQIAEERFKPHIYSMSLGGKAEESAAVDPEAKVIKIMTAAGKIFVVAAGNDGPTGSTINSPGHSPDAVTVGSVSITDRDQVSWFSSRGPTPVDKLAKPDVAFYGGGRAVKENEPEEKLLGPTGYASQADISDRLVGFRPRMSYGALMGTSMATPGVAGLLALWNDKFMALKGRPITRADITAIFAKRGPANNNTGVGIINYSWLK